MERLKWELLGKRCSNLTRILQKLLNLHTITRMVSNRPPRSPSNSLPCSQQNLSKLSGKKTNLTKSIIMMMWGSAQLMKMIMKIVSRRSCKNLKLLLHQMQGAHNRHRLETCFTKRSKWLAMELMIFQLHHKTVAIPRWSFSKIRKVRRTYHSCIAKGAANL